MAVKLRLRRQGRKGTPFYHIVAADARCPRDGKFLEKIGSYDPSRIPAEITLDNEAAIKWLKNGAQPTETVRAILRYRGATLKYALIKQGKSEEEIDRIYGQWIAEKDAAIVAAKEAKKRKIEDTAATRKTAESKIRETKAAAIRAKYHVEPPKPPVVEAPVAEATAEETHSEEVAEGDTSAEA